MTNADGMEIIRAMESDREKAEWYLLHYDDELSRYKKTKQMRLTVQNSQANENIGGGKSSLPGAPTESKAIKSATYDESHDAYLWLKSVEFARKMLGERKNIFIRSRCEAEQAPHVTAGRPAWVERTAQIYFDLARKRFIERPWDTPPSARTVKRWWADIIRRTVEIHLRIEKK